MRIVYRMTGLSGDATEDIIDNLDAKGSDQAKSDEDIYRMADELATNHALDTMLERLASITQQNFTLDRAGRAQEDWREPGRAAAQHHGVHLV